MTACSGSDSTTSAPATGTDSTCEVSADEIVERFDAFVEPYRDLSPEEFLGRPELDGLDDFQADVAQIVGRVTTDVGDDCSDADLEAQVEDALQSYGRDDVLNQFLVGSILQGLEVEPRDVVVTPADDLLTILPLLGPGSSITFSEGTFTLDASLLVQSELTMIGAGRNETILRSSAEAAAIAVLAEGDLVMNDMSVQHVGDLPGSVIIAFDAPVELVRVGISGAVADEDGAGGSGLVVTGITEPEDGAPAPSIAVVTTIDDSRFFDNDSAGIAVTAASTPTILNSEVAANGQCGICYFDSAGGQLQGTTVSANGVGVQASGASSPEVAMNEFVDNLVAGMLIEASSAAVLANNSFVGEEAIGVDIQGEASPSLQQNRFGPHAVAISIRGQSAATVSQNVLTGGEVGLLVGGAANPSVFENEIAETTTAAILHTEASSGQYVTNVLQPAAGAGVVAEGTSNSAHQDVVIEGGLVGFVIREDATGRVFQAVVSGQDVGIEVGNNASPAIEDSVFRMITQAGAILAGSGQAVLTGTTFEGTAEIGIQLGGDGTHEVNGNTVSGGDTAVLIIDDSAAVVIENTLVGQNFGIGITGSAVAIVEDNQIVGAAAAGISIDGSAAPQILRNMLVDAGVVGIRIAGDAVPMVETNTIFAIVAEPSDPAAAPSEGDADEGEIRAESGAGLLFTDSAAGSVSLNQLFGFVIGIQVSDDAGPDLLTNRVDGAGVGGVGILYGLNATGLAQGNLSINQQLGFQVSDAAAPDLVENTVESIEAAAFLLQGDSTPSLTGNSCEATQPGIVILESAAPSLGSNDCALASSAIGN